MRASSARRARNARGQIRHRGEIKTPLGVQRVIDLRAAIGRLAQRHDKLAQFLRRFSEQFHRHLQFSVKR